MQRKLEKTTFLHVAAPTSAKIARSPVWSTWILADRRGTSTWGTAGTVWIFSTPPKDTTIWHTAGKAETLSAVPKE
jgi:hypothetical protein